MSKIDPQASFTFEIYRSRFTDAYASVDRAINERLLRLKAKIQSNHAANVRALKKAEPAPQLSKSAKGKIDQALSQLEQLQIIRNAVAHGQMMALKFEGQDQALFVNAFQPSTLATNAILLSQTQFNQLIKSLESIAKTIREA